MDIINNIIMLSKMYSKILIYFINNNNKSCFHYSKCQQIRLKNYNNNCNNNNSYNQIIYRIKYLIIMLTTTITTKIITILLKMVITIPLIFLVILIMHRIINKNTKYNFNNKIPKMKMKEELQ